MLGPKIGGSVIFLDETDSTNSHAARLLHESYLEEGTAIMAQYQRSGRGQSGTGWESLKGENLLASIVLYPLFLEAREQFLLNQSIALAVHDTLQQLTGKEVSIKWPNDILIEGQKIAGILIENTIRNSRLNQSIIGIGINVNQTAFQSYIPQAVSVSQLTGNRADLTECMAILCSQIDKWYTALRIGQHEKIRETYLRHLFRLNLISEFSDGENRFSGSITGITGDGRLEISCEGKKIEVFSVKEIKLLSY